MIVILDSNILGLLTYPVDRDLDDALLTEAYQCTEWFYYLLARGAYVVTSDICDYEIRRELIRIQSKSVQLLDELRDKIDFLPLSPYLLKIAAKLWAEARNQPNKDLENIDVDTILSAQWWLLAEEFPGRKVVIATKNTDDFERITSNNCANWREIIY